MQNPISILRERGLLAQVTHEQELVSWLAEAPQTFYIGYDPTADSLHAGHLVPLMAARHLAAAGHRFLCLVGGGTAKVGDPSGKSEARPVLGHDAIAANARALRAQVERWLADGRGAELLDNAEWLDGLSLLEFLQGTARHFSVARMLSAESYKARLQQGLTLLEFAYQSLQAFDFASLCERKGCRLQLGGDDQWSNILAGVDLCRRRQLGQAFGLTVPLITTANGAKMGKTQAGALWLSADKTPPSDFYQYWVNVADADLVRLLKLLTLLPLAEIERVGVDDAVTLNAAKSTLAWEVTRMVHGEALARQAHQGALSAFGGRELPATVLPSSTVPRAVAASEDHVPKHVLTEGDPLDLVSVLVAVGWAKSNNEARRLVAQGGVGVDGERMSDPQARLPKERLADLGLLLRAGKKRVLRLTFKR